jgi:hypothetical protein
MHQPACFLALLGEQRPALSQLAAALLYFVPFAEELLPKLLDIAIQLLNKVVQGRTFLTKLGSRFRQGAERGGQVGDDEGRGHIPFLSR